MASGKGARTPGRALKDVLNTGTPGKLATGKRSKHGEDRTVDVGALLRGKLGHGGPLLVPKLRGAGENAPGGSAEPARRSPVAMQSNPAFSPGSPDPSLAAAASKLAHLKASSRLGGAAPVQQPLPAATPAARAVPQKLSAAPAAAQPAVREQPQPLAAGLARLPATAQAPSLPEPPTKAPAAASPLESPPCQQQQRQHGTPGPTPEYRPEGRVASSDEEQVPLAARTAILKRHRRKSQHHGPERFGDWAQVDDDELEKQLEEWNLGKETEQQQQQGSVGMAAAAPGAAAAAPAVEPRMTRAQRRKSMLPAGGLGRPQLGEGGAPAALQREPSDEEKAAEARKEVADKVQAITSELCTQLDSLIEASPKEKGRKRKTEDDRSLHEKLVEAWDGKSYYERLMKIAAEEEEEEAAAKQHQQPVQQGAQPAGQPKLPKLNLKVDLPPSASAPPSSSAACGGEGGSVKTPGRARRVQQLSELTESLKKLQVSGSNRTSKAAATLASRGLQSAPGSRTASPMAAAALDVARNPFSAAVLAAAAAPEPAKAAGKQVSEAKPQAAVLAALVVAEPAKLSPAPKAEGPSSPAVARPLAQQKEALAVTNVRMTRAKSRSPQPNPVLAAADAALRQKAAPAAARRAGAAASPLATAGPVGGDSTPAASGQGEAELRAALEATNKKLTAAAEGRKAAEERVKELQGQLAAEKEARKAAQQQADELAGQLKEEGKARKAAERRAENLGAQLEELQRRAELSEGVERTLGRVAERALESSARYAAAESQLSSILKAANSLGQALAQGKEEAHALHELASGRGEAGAAAGGAGTAQFSRGGRQQAKPVGWR